MTGAVQQEVNFGRNFAWQTLRYRPKDEAELLDILQRHSRDTIRAHGSKHSWSDIAAGAAVSLDMGCFDQVTPFAAGGQSFVRVGAGVTIQALLDRLHASTDQTLPTLGAIKKQTISGAISTGTHGSGRQTISHFVSNVRLAAYDSQTLQPTIHEFDSGAELKAARCGLGCLGIIVSVDLPTVPKYKVSETLRSRAGLGDILRLYPEQPLTMFMWVPYAWQWIAFERRPVGQTKSGPLRHLKALVMRGYNVIGQDIVFHVLLLLNLALGAWAVKGFLRRSPRVILKSIERVDDAEHVLTLGHHYFRHEEMELFVHESRLEEAAEIIRCVIEVFAASRGSVSENVQRGLVEMGLGDEPLLMPGRYVHHYPVIFRRVLPDDTLVSMSASMTGPIYSISFFTYDPPGKRESFYDLCSAIAHILRNRVDARPHWGKHFPLGFADIAPLYPEMEMFRELCRRNDPNSVFRNDYTRRVLQLEPGERSASPR